MAPFHHFFFFLSLPAIYTSGRVLHVQSTCFHANTELPVTYAWALVASCSLKELLSSFACQYLPKTWSEWWSRTNAGGGTWKPVNFFRSLEKKTGSSLDRDSGFDSILSARDDEGGRLTGQLSRMVGGGGGNTVQLLLDFRSERRWEWNTGRLTKSCPALICSW